MGTERLDHGGVVAEDPVDRRIDLRRREPGVSVPEVGDHVARLDGEDHHVGARGAVHGARPRVEQLLGVGVEPAQRDGHIEPVQDGLRPQQRYERLDGERSGDDHRERLERPVLGERGSVAFDDQRVGRARPQLPQAFDAAAHRRLVAGFGRCLRCLTPRRDGVVPARHGVHGTDALTPGAGGARPGPGTPRPHCAGARRRSPWNRPTRSLPRRSVRPEARPSVLRSTPRRRW